MGFGVAALLAGALLVLMALGGTVLARLPLSTAMLYLGVGVLASPWGLGLWRVDIATGSKVLEHLAEVVVLASLFTSGLKLSAGLRDQRWMLPFRLAVVSMVVTVGLIAAFAHFVLKLPAGASVLLGGILAPTDPVLASDVQVTHPQDRDRLRFALTGEGGLNDGTAMPFVLLGLAMLGLGKEEPGWHWLLVEGVLGSLAGLAVGAVLGLAIGRLVLYLRRKHQEAVGTDDFLALGLIGLSYGLAQLMHVNGFLAVFAAGIALRYLETSEGTGEATRRKVEEVSADPDQSAAEAVAVDPEHAPAYMAQAVLGFNEQIERIGELTVVVAIGLLLWSIDWSLASWAMVAVLLLAIRPAAVLLGLARSPSSRGQRWLVGWFGIRGVGSLYYLMFSINHGLPPELASSIAALTLAVVVTSIVVHGISVTPVMAAYERRVRPRRRSG